MNKLISLLLGLLFCTFVLRAVFAAEPEVMNDGKIVGISLMTDQAQIQGSQFAYPRIQYFDLKNFANTMVVDYQNYEKTIMDFAQRTGIAPQESLAADEIKARAKVVLAELYELSGQALEKKYIEAQVELHQKTLGTIDQIFLPSASNIELRNLINTIRPAVQNKLEWALRIQINYPSQMNFILSELIRSNSYSTILDNN